MDFPATPSNASDSNEYPSTTRSPYNNVPDDNKRRSSSRSIKRRRFDDELVEYSGLPGSSLGKGDKRMRTQSYTSQVSEIPMTSVPTPPTHQPAERRRASSKVSGGASMGRKIRRKGQLSHLSTKDLGRWKPTDDLALILGVQQTNDLRLVHRGVKFSCRFTVSELQSRWYALLYNAEISRVAIAAMRNLHPDLVALIQQQALYSTAEEELLATIPAVPSSLPPLERFQELLDQNPHVFYPSRNAKTLLAHWQLLKQYHLLPDQTVQPLPKNPTDPILTFSDAEDTMNDNELPDYKEDGMDSEMQMADRVDKKDIRLLETSLSRWQVLVQSLSGTSVELDKNTLAVLRGRLVRFLMRSREIAVGRSTRDNNIDVDLTLEGPAAKVSRKQATIRLRNSGDFFMSSEGKRPIFVDGRPVLPGNKVKLNHNTVIEIAGLRFVFLVNQELISAIRQEAVKVNIPV